MDLICPSSERDRYDRQLHLHRTHEESAADKVHSYDREGIHHTSETRLMPPERAQFGDAFVMPDSSSKQS